MYLAGLWLLPAAEARLFLFFAMRIQLLLAGLGLASATAQAQTPPAGDTVRVGSRVYTYVEQQPQPPGGMEGLMQYLSSHLQYPPEALRQGIEGKVFVSFVVSETGALEHVQVSRSVHPLLDVEAVRVFQAMPAWTPGKQVGRPVRVAYTVPLTFRLPEPQPGATAAPGAPGAGTYPFDVAAEYPGGLERMRQDVRKMLRATAKAQMKGVQGRMFVKFLVDATGQVRDVSIFRGLSPALDAEVVRVFQQLPAWKPGQYQGQPVPVSFTIPLTFGPGGL